MKNSKSFLIMMAMITMLLMLLVGCNRSDGELSEYDEAFAILCENAVVTRVEEKVPGEVVVEVRMPNLGNVRRELESSEGCVITDEEVVIAASYRVEDVADYITVTVNDGVNERGNIMVESAVEAAIEKQFSILDAAKRTNLRLTEEKKMTTPTTVTVEPIDCASIEKYLEECEDPHSSGDDLIEIKKHVAVTGVIYTDGRIDVEIMTPDLVKVYRELCEFTASEVTNEAVFKEAVKHTHDKTMYTTKSFYDMSRNELEDLSEIADQVIQEQIESLELWKQGAVKASNNGALVTDVYANTYESPLTTYEYHIPQVHLYSKEAQTVNDEIFKNCFLSGLDEQYRFEGKTEYIRCLGISYVWGVNDGVLSLCVEYIFNCGIEEYYVYNIDVTTGKVLDKDEFLEAIDMTVEEFNALTKQIVGSYVWGDFLLDEQGMPTSMFNCILEESLKDEYIEAARPYLNEKGELCIVARIKSVAGAAYNYIPINTEEVTIVPHYDQKAPL